MKTIYREILEDLLKWSWYIAKAGLIAGYFLILLYCSNAGYDIYMEGFIITVYSAFVTATIIVCDKWIGTFTKSEIAGAQANINEQQKQTLDTTKAMDNTEQLDIIEARREDISIEEFKEKKYGNALYDYGKSEVEKVENAKEAAELRKKLAELEPTPEEVKPDGG